MRYLAALWFTALACLAIGFTIASLIRPPEIVVRVEQPLPLEHDYPWDSTSLVFDGGAVSVSGATLTDNVVLGPWHSDTHECPPCTTDWYGPTCEQALDGRVICYSGDLPSQCKRTPEGLDCPTPEWAQ